jgi:hypothetical protein
MSKLFPPPISHPGPVIELQLLQTSVNKLEKRAPTHPEVFDWFPLESTPISTLGLG